MKLKCLVITAIVILAWIGYPSWLSAHGFGERYDLPIPLNYFLIGAAATVAFSFVVIGWFVRRSERDFDYRRLNLWESPVFRTIARVLSTVMAVLSVGLLLVVVGAGFYGTSDALDNFAPTFVWIIWWVGVGYVVALVGNIWAIVNPWQIIFEWFEILFNKPIVPSFRWPDWLDAWPALVGFLLFAWVENVYTGGSRPFNLAVLILIYSTVTWTGMILFGKHVCLKRGDPFAVLFALFARFSPTEIRVNSHNSEEDICLMCQSGCSWNTDLSECIDCYECWELSDDSERRFSLRPWASGLARGERVTTALVAFHITALSTVTYDGLSETPAWVTVQSLMWPLVDPLPGSAVATIDSIGTIGLPLLFAAIYVVVCRMVSRSSGGRLTRYDAAHSVGFSLVPIALAYNLSHYLSFLLIAGQQIIPLLSDPIGSGIDLFGTASYIPNIAVINARAAWIVSIVSLVSGHVVSVYIAHVISLRRLREHTIAVKSQYPMLVLMVFYTAVSLWIISLPLIG